MASANDWEDGGEVNKGQGATFALFVIFIGLVLFVSKTGTGFWQTLLTKTDYELINLGSPFGNVASTAGSIVHGLLPGSATAASAKDVGPSAPSSGAA